MKKALKIVAIVLASIVLLLCIGVGVLSHFLFTPEKLTPIVRTQAAKYLTCKSEVGNVELTLFSTFPSLSLKVNHLELINSADEQQLSDTIMSVENVYLALDVKKFLFKDQIEIEGLTIDGFSASLMIDSTGTANFDILSPSLFSENPDTTESEPFENPFTSINLSEIIFKNGTISYTDEESKMNAAINVSNIDFEAAMVESNIKGVLSASFPELSFDYEKEKYVNSIPLKMDVPFVFDLSKMEIDLDKADLELDGNGIILNGSAGYNSENGDITADILFESKQLLIEKLMQLIPESFDTLIAGIDLSGGLLISGSVVGTLNETQMPLCNLNVDLSQTKFKYSELPLNLKEIGGNIVLYSDFLTDSISYIELNSIKGATDKSTFMANGRIDRIFSDMLCDLNAELDFDLEDAMPFIPDDMNVSAKGRIQGSASAKLTVAQLESLDFPKMKISGSFNLLDVEANYDSMFVSTNSSKIDFFMPNRQGKSKTSFIQADMLSKDLQVAIGDSIKADITHAFLDLSTSNLLDTTSMPNVFCDFAIDKLAASMSDTIAGSINNAKGLFEMYALGLPQPDIKLTCKTDSIAGQMGEFAAASVKSLSIAADVKIDDTKSELLDQFKASGTIDLKQAMIKTNTLASDIQIPSIKFDFEPEKYTIKESHFIIDRSDFNLSGELRDVAAFLRDESLLKGNFDFESDVTDLNSLMAMTSGFGSEEEDSLSATEATSADSTQTSEPFMVPKGLDVLLRANIKKAYFGPDSATDIYGDVTLKDGILLLDSIRVTTPATKIQMTALYRTPRKNHLFVGLDFHMLDVEISELLSMVPDIDSLMPMLRSFGGSGEFHMAIETYLDSLYNVKMSTLRGAASVQGQDLVLMDGETFSQIAKTLQFSKSAINKVDSLSAEFTIFKEEIDVYPFLIVMDKYKAVVGGRHNLDMTFDYHISVTDSPLPFRLGVDVKGNLDDMKIRPATCKYAALYRPVRRREVDRSQLELRAMIRKALTEGITQ